MDASNVHDECTDPPIEGVDDATDWRRTTDVAREQIARRAYELYVERGRELGHDLDDWLAV